MYNNRVMKSNTEALADALTAICIVAAILTAFLLIHFRYLEAQELIRVTAQGVN